MGHLNLISLIWLTFLFFYVKFISKKDEATRDRFLKAQLLLVLLYNIGILFVFPWKLPVELSTSSYFVVPIIVLFNIKYLKAWGVYASILTGFVYFVAMLTIGNFLYADFPPYSVYTSMYNHGALLTYAYITLSTTRIYKSERIIIWLGIILSAIWALILRPFNAFTGRIFIYEVLNAYFVKDFFPNNMTISYIIYYIFLVTILLLSANVVHLLNNKINKQN